MIFFSIVQVDEIMLALKTSFQSLYEQTKQQGHQVCINCPLHQYHKLCEDITGIGNVLKFLTLDIAGPCSTIGCESDC